jgi:hypothetical protein
MSRCTDSVKACDVSCPICGLCLDTLDDECRIEHVEKCLCSSKNTLNILEDDYCFICHKGWSLLTELDKQKHIEICLNTSEENKMEISHSELSDIYKTNAISSYDQDEKLFHESSMDLSNIILYKMENGNTDFSYIKERYYDQQYDENMIYKKIYPKNIKSTAKRCISPYFNRQNLLSSPRNSVGKKLRLTEILNNFSSTPSAHLRQRSFDERVIDVLHFDHIRKEKTEGLQDPFPKISTSIYRQALPSRGSMWKLAKGDAEENFYQSEWIKEFCKKTMTFF